MLSKYETHVEPKLFLIECWARDGVLDADIAKNLGIAYSTFRKYRDANIELAEALKKGKEVIDFEIENALLKRARGYEFEEVKTYIEKNEIGRETKRMEKTIKHVAPDTTAQIFWLKNRKTKEWMRIEKEKFELEKQRFELEKERFELEKLKFNPVEIEIENDGFVEALKHESKSIWEGEQIDDSEQA